MITRIPVSLRASLVAACLFAAAAWAEPPIVEAEGQIHQIDYGTNELVISGVAYRMAYDADVRVRGSHGAFTMLQNGMKVAFIFKRERDLREIFELEQLPDSTVLEES
jgi:hypothetical protein